MLVTLQTAIAFSTLILAWMTLSLPDYLLQFFAVAMVLFVIVNRLRRKKTPTLGQPTATETWLRSAELAIAGFAILLLIGGTGGLASWWLPLFFIYIFFSAFVNQIPVTVLISLTGIGFLYYFTENFGSAYYGNILSIIIFTPIAIFAQRYYARAIKENLSLQLERDKVAYYNLYAEKQREIILAGAQTAIHPSGSDDFGTFIQNLIPQIDNLQKESRFPENQLVVSARLTKIGLSLRQALKKGVKNDNN